MKKAMFLFLVVLLFSSTSKIMAQKVNIKELYYSVNEGGEVNRKKVLEERRLVYDKKRGLISIKNILETPGCSQSDLYYKLPETGCEKGICKYDENKRIVEYSEQQNEAISAKHFYTYNNWGDLIEDKYMSTNTSGEILTESVLSYEYVYLDDFIYAKKKNKNFISGVKPDYSSSWVLRIIRKGEAVVQYTERKISK